MRSFELKPILDHADGGSTFDYRRFHFEYPHVYMCTDRSGSPNLSHESVLAITPPAASGQRALQRNPWLLRSYILDQARDSVESRRQIIVRKSETDTNVVIQTEVVARDDQHTLFCDQSLGQFR